MRLTIGFRILIRFNVMDMTVSLISIFYKKSSFYKKSWLALPEDYQSLKLANDSSTVFSLLLGNDLQAIKSKSNLLVLFLVSKHILLAFNFYIALDDQVEHNSYGSQSP